MPDIDTSFERVVRDHYAQVFRFVRRRTTRAEDAEDITQTVFSEALSAFERTDVPSSPPLALLYTIARRRLIDMARRSRNDASLDQLSSQPGLETYGKSLADVLASSIADLPETQRLVVLMKIVQGRSHAEIAERLQVSEGASRMQLNRALTALRDMLEEEGVSP